MFCERLNRLMNDINAGNGDIAEIAGFDRSNVSRLRSGSRVPRKGGASVGRLSQAIVDLAVSRGSIDKLCAAIGCSENTNGDMMRNMVEEWLCDDNKPKSVSSEKSHDRSQSAAVFGRKLSRLTELAGISSVNLSKAVNIDPSYLSRMRTGKRLPGGNSRVLEDICSVLIKKITEKQRLSELAGIMGENMGNFSTEPEHLSAWLMNVSEEAYKVSVDRLIQRIGTLSPEITAPIPPVPQEVIESVACDESLQYRGTDGLRKAVTRFLLSAEKRGSTLWLYSDQSMDWMSGSYNALWQSLLASALSRGVKIRIIHDIERGTAEMLNAISSWLPLYMTGMIEPYYCTLPSDSRFGCTMFLEPGFACIEGFCVRGTESECEYHYVTDSEQLEVREREYSRLMEMSRRLVEITPGVAQNVPDSLQRTIGDVQVTLSGGTVVLAKLTSPSYSFRFDHPLLAAPFRNFVM